VTDQAPYERAVRLARETIAASLRDGATIEELEGGLLERRLVAPAPRPRPRPRRRGDRPASSPALPRERAHAAR
jgi:hypothetical protein